MNPNPEYVDAKYEEAFWSPSTGKILFKEITRTKHYIICEGKDENGIVRGKLIPLHNNFNLNVGAQRSH